MTWFHQINATLYDNAKNKQYEFIWVECTLSTDFAMCKTHQVMNSYFMMSIYRSQLFIQQLLLDGKLFSPSVSQFVDNTIP